MVLQYESATKDHQKLTESSNMEGRLKQTYKRNFKEIEAIHQHTPPNTHTQQVKLQIKITNLRKIKAAHLWSRILEEENKKVEGEEGKEQKEKEEDSEVGRERKKIHKNGS